MESITFSLRNLSHSVYGIYHIQSTESITFSLRNLSHSVYGIYHIQSTESMTFSLWNLSHSVYGIYLTFHTFNSCFMLLTSNHHNLASFQLICERQLTESIFFPEMPMGLEFFVEKFRPERLFSIFVYPIHTCFDS
jgi:hypothetical protein